MYVSAAERSGEDCEAHLAVSATTCDDDDLDSLPLQLINTQAHCSVSEAAT